MTTPESSTPKTYTQAEVDALIVKESEKFSAMIKSTKEDKDIGSVTCGWNKYRNFKTLADKPRLDEFKLYKEFNMSRFRYLSF